MPRRRKGRRTALTLGNWELDRGRTPPILHLDGAWQGCRERCSPHKMFWTNSTSLWQKPELGRLSLLFPKMGSRPSLVHSRGSLSMTFKATEGTDHGGEDRPHHIKTKNSCSSETTSTRHAALRRWGCGHALAAHGVDRACGAAQALKSSEDRACASSRGGGQRANERPHSTTQWGSPRASLRPVLTCSPPSL